MYICVHLVVRLPVTYNHKKDHSEPHVLLCRVLATIQLGVGLGGDFELLSYFHNSAQFDSEQQYFVKVNTKIPQIVLCPDTWIYSTEKWSNKWLHNIKIKNYSVCDNCMNLDDFLHFFIRCIKVKEIWLHWFNRWENISGIVMRNSQVIEECIYFLFFHPIVMVCKYLILYIIHKVSNVYLIITHLTSIPAWTNSSKP